MSKMALISGTTSGLGEAFCHLLAKDGYDLILLSRNESKLLHQQAYFQQKYGIKIVLLPFNISCQNSVDQAIDTIAKNNYEVEIVINNAGFNHVGDFAKTDQVVELEMINLHIVSVTKLTKFFLLRMIQKGRGKILNVGSIGSFAPCPGNSVYCATKSYIYNLSSALYDEAKGRGVTVSCLCPGATQTAFVAKADLQKTLLFRKFSGSSEKVAKRGYEGVMRGERVIIPGILNKMMVFSFPFIPQKLLSMTFRMLLKK